MDERSDPTRNTSPPGVQKATAEPTGHRRRKRLFRQLPRLRTGRRRRPRHRHRRPHQNGMANAQRNNLTVRYTVGDASSASVLTSSLLRSDTDATPPVRETFDVVVALHACGALSDVAL